MNKKSGSAFIIVVCIQLMIVLLLIATWIVNFVKFVHCDFKAPYKAEVIHGIGIIPAISVVTCWFSGDMPAEPVDEDL